ncbi:type I polyketide synthase [Streptomyces sp. JB150]|uniref:type I polyketide synthase n=1 Tax=Streptomyces sp. JB150 TaxID=2714844 RepID=UPI0014094263|nr:type I polyketide synthase [Streptomyces sp. JB150]QIJ65457.1 type I polyketide synthase [Streptomyces sp. JB150]
MTGELRRLLIERIARHSGLSEDGVDEDRPFAAYGLASRDMVALSGDLEDLLDRTLPPIVLWQYPTIRRLVAFLTGAPESPAPVRTAAGREGDIAVVGLGCRLPGGIGSPAGLWEALACGRDAVGTVPDGRWEPYRRMSPGHAAAVDRANRHGGFLAESDVDGFDAEFYGISPAEAAEMDPQQRLLLEVAWEALEHAGLPADRLAGSRTCVYVGACGDDHGRTALEDLPSITARTGTGSAPSIIANRLSYALDLRGPSVTVDTACSSSLVALHLARTALLAGECDTALVGGVNLLLSPGVTLNFAESGALSPGGRCKPFSAAADGYVRAEGCVVTVLRGLDDAVRDGDRVLAVLRATGTNQDGRSNGLMAPNPAAQEALIREVWHASGLDPADAGYIEAHGTGTPLGDPIEATALGAALGRHRPTGSPLPIGSVKSNLGHLEGAAGLAGLAKCALALHHELLPATLHHAAPNPRIPFTELGLSVVDRPVAWHRGTRPRTAGVSSFGFGGTNAHAVLVEAPAPVPATTIN